MSRAATRLVTGTAGFVGAVCTTVLLTAPAVADDILGPSEGHDPGDGLGVAATLLIFVAVPVVAMLVVSALVLLPGLVKGSRYRPARGWAAEPIWFAGPVGPQAALAGAVLGDVTRGGASGSW